MRVLSVVAVVALVVIAGIIVSQVELPVIEGVTGEQVRRWYMNQAALAVLIGLCIGIPWGVRSSRAVPYEPGESARRHEHRIRVHGLKGMAVSFVISLCLGLVLAALASFVPEDPGARIGALVFDIKFVGALLCSMASMALCWAVTLRVIGKDGARVLSFSNLTKA